MNESYKRIYYDLIGEQFNKVIIRYNPIEKKINIVDLVIMLMRML